MAERSLPVLGAIPNVVLARAVFDVVRAKRMLDNNGRNSINAMLAGGLPEDLRSGAAWPSSLMEAVLPFLELTGNNSQQLSALVPVAQTIGMSWNWVPHDVSPAKRQALIKLLTDPRRAERGDYEKSETFWIRPLGIFLAHEGKNRVAFLEDSGVELMPSLVKVVDYPAPERLLLFNVSDGCEQRVLCALDREYLIPVESPSWSVPLLTAYGVCTERWPPDWPDVETVCEQLRRRTPVPRNSSRLPAIEISVLKEQLALPAADLRPDSLLGHRHIRFCAQPLMPPALAVVALLLTAAVWPEAWEVEGIIGAFCIGALTAAAAILLLPLVALRSEVHQALHQSRHLKTRRGRLR